MKKKGVRARRKIGKDDFFEFYLFLPLFRMFLKVKLNLGLKYKSLHVIPNIHIMSHFYQFFKFILGLYFLILAFLLLRTLSFSH